MPEASSACSFPSRYGGGYITASNYITEVMCERLALKDGVGSLPHKFWNTPKWKKIYFQQLLIANSFLKMYSPTAILNTLRRNPKCYSLRARWIDDQLKNEQDELDKKKKQMEESVKKEQEKIEETTTPVVIIEGSSKPREAFAAPGKPKLRDLD